MKKIMQFFKYIYKKRVSRREFFKVSGKGIMAVIAGSVMFKLLSGKVYAFSGRPKRSARADADVVKVTGNNPYQATVAAIAAMGGMERFVKKGAIVLVKPNIGWDRSPQQAANTNPEVVAAVIDLCFKAGAKRVNVFDRTCNDARRCYANSGIAEAAKAKGASVFHFDDWNVVKANFSYDSPMQGWPIARDAVECDTFINMPVLKHHGLTELTLSMKNLMGVCGDSRGQIHANIGTKLTDLTDLLQPDLTIIDAWRVLVRNGPSGGNIEDVQEHHTVIAGTDPVLTDAYAAQFMGRDPLSISYIACGHARGVGSADLAKARIKELSA